MPLREATYAIAPKGLATSFAEAELPVQYAAVFRNRFINAAGGAEKRQGLARVGNQIPNAPTITAIHELIEKDGTAILLVSGVGMIWRFDTPDWTLVYSGGNASGIYQAVQFGDKLIFVNGIDRNIYTEDGATFYELRAITEQGTATAGTSATSIRDADITNWNTTNVELNDLVWDQPKNGFGIVTSIASAAIGTTTINSAGAGGTGIGLTTAGQPESGDGYVFIDLVENNIVSANPEPDNVAVAGSGTSSNKITVSAMDFSTTDIWSGDIVYNSTRNAVTNVLSVSADISVTPLSGQVAGDSLVFLKSAMPIASYAHVHYGRAYYVDARDQRKIRISGAEDPQDMTQDAGTLNASTFNFGSLQPEGDAIISLTSFQRFFIAAGRKNVYAYAGTVPIATSGQSTDFAPVGLFPQGCVSSRGLISIGNDALFATLDGLQAISIVNDASNLSRANLSEPIKVTLRQLIETTPEAQIQLIHYPHRSFVVFKVGSQLFIYNYTTFHGDRNPNANQGSWSIFDGGIAQQNAYFVRRDGTFLCAGSNGNVFEFDGEPAVYGDNGQAIVTEYETGWLTFAEPRRTKKIKQVNYIDPLLDVGNVIDYTIAGQAGFDGESTESITISTSGAATPIGIAVVGQSQVGGSSVQNIKYPFRLRGEVAKINISNSNTLGPDILSRYTLYWNEFGRR